MSSTAPIIAAIDFSAASSIVLRHAVQAAKLTGAEVHAVHVLDSSTLAHRAENDGSNPVVDRLVSQATRHLEEMVQANFPDSDITLEVRYGRPQDELRLAVKECNASLLVIAANDLTKKRLGSTASRCVRFAPCDVLVLRDWQDGPFKKLLVCTDFSKTSAHALDHAVALAKIHDAVLEIVHIMYPPSRDHWGKAFEHADDPSTKYAEECHTRVEERMTNFLEPHAKALTTIPHRHLILESTLPAAALTHRIQTEDVDLVVLGTRIQSGISGFFIGTNAERLLHDATVSVLAVRD